MQKILLKAHERFYSLKEMVLHLSRELIKQKQKSQVFSRLEELWRSARTGRHILREWQDETQQFLAEARKRLAERSLN